MPTRYVRYLKGGQDSWGTIRDDGPSTLVTPLHGNPLDGTQPANEPDLPLAEVELLVPAYPTKVVGVGLNYARHAAESNKPIPEEPLLFLKPTSSLIPHSQTINIPDVSRLVHHEAELAIVIARRCRNVSVDEAHRFILGFTAANDVSDRTLQRRDGQFTRGKGFDTFCPVGPALAIGIDADDVAIECWVNGALRQSSRTSDMVFDIATIVSFVSNVMTLEPWDLILTGTPEGVGAIGAGDVVDVGVAGVGRLSNRVARVPKAVGELHQLAKG